jgi:hypothetical protein
MMAGDGPIGCTCCQRTAGEIRLITAWLAGLAVM